MPPRRPTTPVRTSSDPAVHPTRTPAHRRGRDRGGRRRHAHRHDRPGPPGRRLRGGVLPPPSCPGPGQSRSTRGPRPCTWACSPPGSDPGDEVIVPSFTFAATANSVAITGATPVFADIDPLTFTLSPAAVEAAITPRTRAIMPVHLYGHPAPMDALQAIADEHGLMVFEDAAQAHGATLHGRAVGSFGTFAAFSFYPTKNMTSGEGGMVTSTDPEIIRGVRLARNQGMETRYANEIVGLNNRMTDIHAAIGRVQLTKVGAWTRARQEQRRVPGRPPARRHRPARRPRRHPRLPPVHDPRGRRPRRLSPPPCARNTASARASTTRFRTTSCRPSPATPPSWSCPPRARPPTRFSPCRSTRP